MPPEPQSPHPFNSECDNDPTELWGESNTMTHFLDYNVRKNNVVVGITVFIILLDGWLALPQVLLLVIKLNTEVSHPIWATK